MCCRTLIWDELHRIVRLNHQRPAVVWWILSSFLQWAAGDSVEKYRLSVFLIYFFTSCGAVQHKNIIKYRKPAVLHVNKTPELCWPQLELMSGSLFWWNLLKSYYGSFKLFVQTWSEEIDVDEAVQVNKTTQNCCISKETWRTFSWNPANLMI